MTLISTFTNITPPENINPDKVEKQVAAIGKEKKNPIHFYMDADVFRAMKIKIATEGITMTEYLNKLIRKDTGLNE